MTLQHRLLLHNIAQYYSWYIGLGNNYNATTYGAKFALPRIAVNPTLSERLEKLMCGVVGLEQRQIKQMH
jgi:hypothetical protein